ncbi:collagen alpha-1(XII) chain-like isoform X2 [Styela clava]
MEHRNPGRSNFYHRGLTFGIIIILAWMTPQTEAQKEECRQRPMDIVFVIDGSRSVRPWNFKTVQDAVKDMVDAFEKIGPEETQIGLVQYSSRVRQEFKLNDYYSKEEVNEAIDGIKYMEMGTMTGRALKFITEYSFTAAYGARSDNPDVLKVAVVITDGRAQDRTVPFWQKKAKDAGIILFAIGVGRRISDKDLLLIASEPKEKHKFYVKNFDLIGSIPVMLHEQICDVDECEQEIDNCQQTCKNTIGSFICGCKDGFVLQDDRASCLPIAPSNLESLTLTDITHTTMRATWSLVSPELEDMIDHYLVRYKKAGDEGEAIEVTVNERAIVLEGLEPGTEYLVSVTAYTADGLKSETIKAQNTTLFLGETTLDLFNPTLTTMQAKWEPAGGDLLSQYVLTITSPEQNRTFTITTDADTTEAPLLEGLEPGQLYEGVVTPMYGKLAGGPGRDTETTKSLIKPNIRVTDTTLSTVDVEFTGIGMPADRYELTLVDVETGETKYVEVDGSESTAKFYDCTPGKEYTVTVRGYITEGGREFESPEGVTEGKTKHIPAPVVDITSTGLATADVMWTISEYTPLLFKVSYCPKNDPENKKHIETEDISTKLTGLEPGVEYEVEVVAVDFDDDKKFTSEPGSDTDTTKSLHAPPVMATGRTYTTATVKWGEIGMPANTWELRYHPVGSPDIVKTSVFDGSVNKTILEGLTHDTEYEVVVVGVVIEEGERFESPPGSDPFTLGALDPPVVTISDPTTSSLNSAWVDNVDADNYVISIKEVGDTETPEKIITDGAVAEKVFESLKPGTFYEVEVIIQVDDEGNIIESPPGSTTGATKPAPPVNLVVADSDPTSLTVTFDPPEGGYEYFEAKCVPYGTDPESVPVMRVDREATSVTCKDLKPGTRYKVHITTCFGGMKSKPAIIESVLPVDAPANFDLSNPTVHTILATWDPPPNIDEVTGYILVLRSEKLGTIHKKKLPGSETSFTFTSLNPATKYDGEIRALVGEVESPPATDSEITYPDVIKIEVIDISYNNITVKWTKSAHPDISSQKLTYTPQSEDESSGEIDGIPTETVVEYLTPDVNTYVIRNVKPATIYDITIQYVYPDSESAIATTEAITLAPPPGTPYGTNVTDIQFILHWGFPEYNAEPIGYTVTYVPTFGEMVFETEIPSGEVLDLRVQDLQPSTQYNVTVVANYGYHIVSEPVEGTVTTEDPSNEAVCTCSTYLRKQSEMQGTLNDLVSVIQTLTRKIERMERSISIGSVELNDEPLGIRRGDHGF